MSDQGALIQRKHEVQGEIARLRRQVETLRERGGGRREAARLAELEGQLDAFMAEEARLRQLIDRSR